MAAPHYEMIAAAYGIAAFVICGMWIHILADRRELRAGLAHLQKQSAPEEDGVD